MTVEHVQTDAPTIRVIDVIRNKRDGGELSLRKSMRWFAVMPPERFPIIRPLPG